MTSDPKRHSRVITDGRVRTLLRAWRHRVAQPMRCCTCWQWRARPIFPSTIDDFDTVSKRTPLLADLKPGGRYVAVDLDRAGGGPLLVQRLVSAGLVEARQMTPSGRTIGEEARKTVESPGQEVVRPLSNPLKPNGGLVILKGNLAPVGCVVRIAGHERLYHRGPARVFDREEEAMRAVTHGEIKSGDVVIIRYEGPLGGPGMREMLGVTGAIVGAGLGETVALITDGRFSGATSLIFP